MKEMVSYVILRSFVGFVGAGIVSLICSFPIEILALIPLSRKKFVCISSPESTNSGMCEPTWVTNSSPANGMKLTVLCVEPEADLTTTLMQLQAEFQCMF